MIQLTINPLELSSSFLLHLRPIGTRQYELPTSETIGAIVFGNSSATENEFDLIIEEHSRFPQRVNKLHPCYMALQFPLLFVYGEDGYQKDMKLANVQGQSTKANKQMSMNMYYWNGYLRKGRKTKPKQQNRTRNGKAWKRQSQDKAQV
ncbi:hypothetical protein Tco_1130237 [Tanacetum coccineum]